MLGLTKDYKSFMVMTLKDRKLNNRNDIITIEEILDLEDYYRLEDKELETMCGGEDQTKSLVQGTEDDEPSIIDVTCAKILDKLNEEGARGK